MNMLLPLHGSNQLYDGYSGCTLGRGDGKRCSVVAEGEK